MKLKLGISFGLLLFIVSCKEAAKPSLSLEKAIPSNTVWMMEVNDWEELSAKKDLSRPYQQISQLDLIQDFENHLTAIQEGLEAESTKTFLQQSELFLVNMISGAERYNWLLLAKTPSEIGARLKSSLEARSGIEKQEYSNEAIYYLPLNQEQNLYFYQKDELILVSGTRLCLESSLRQMQSDNSMQELKELSQIRQTRNQDAPANLYLNLAKADDYLNSFLIQNQMGFLEEHGNWLSLDLDAEGQDIIATGLLNHPSSQAYYPSVFKDLKADNIEAQSIIPQNIAQWTHLSIGGIGQYQRAFESYLEQKGSINQYENLIDKLPEGIKEDLQGIIDNEIGTFEAGRNNERSFHFAYFNFRDLELCQQSLEIYSDSSFIEGYRGHIIRKLKAQNVLARLYGDLFTNIHHPYYSLQGNYVLLCDDIAALKVALNDILDNKTLDRLDSYQSLQNQLPGKAHIQVVYGYPEWIPNRKADFEKSLSAELNLKQDSLSTVRWGIFQVRANHDRSFISAMIREEKPIQEKIVRQWSTQISASLEGEPQFLRNHNTNKLDIAICDENNTLYLISRKGEIYWQKSLDGPIIGEIKQLDIYKNNKLQMAFNTAHSLYVLDRLGRDVEGFPVKLEAEATAPMGLFNYDAARNYRLVVPCGPKLFNYNVDGKAVKGWNFKKAEADIISEPQHFSVGGKDIIVCLSADGKLFQLNRRGEERFQVAEKIEELKTSFYLKEGKSLKESELIAGSNSGKMYVIKPEGQVDAIYLDQAHPADHLIFFEDRYIFSDDEGLFVKDDRKPFSASLEDDISSKPKAMILNNRFYVAAFSAKAEEIRLFNEDGELVDGFPVFAQGPFDMGSLNRDKNLNIVTYSSDGTLICYRLR